MEREQLDHLRHSCAHLLAAAVEKMYPDAKRTIGPPVENGFYYDFDFSAQGGSALGGGVAPTINDLPRIEKTMKKLLPTWKTFECVELSAEEAKEKFKGNEYKCELINEIVAKGEKITVYKSGDFEDLCRGGHVENPKEELKNFKLQSVAGAYWRGDEKNKMLTRIYGTAFATAEELEAHLTMLKEAKERDHRLLGERLDIYAFDEEVGPGMPLWLPNGAILIEEIEKFAKEVEENYGYSRVRTPHVAKEALYLRSGHLPYYKESMFPPMQMDNETYYLKAMNCPHHHKIYGARKHSYRDLPIRLAEYGTCYRYEDSGSLFGLMRVRSLSMNDAHIYCTEDQFEEEFIKVIDMYKYYFDLFGVSKYQMRLSKHSKEGLGKKYVDNEKLWIQTEEQVRNALIKSHIPFVEAEDEAAFYGPKIDVEIWSVIGREFTLATNQLDFAVPERFNLTYTSNDGQEKTPICIHRAPLSTHERLIGFLIEHYAGNFPVWLSPAQVHFIPVSTEKHLEGTRALAAELKKRGIRVTIDEADETVGKKIRNAAKSKVPYVLVIGDKELSGEDFMIRVRGQEQQESMSKAAFIERVEKEIVERSS